jgi:hypothetical protein
MDGLPKGANTYEIFRAEVLQGSSSLNLSLAQKVEQGMGRATRGAGDYCVVLLVGSELVSWVARSDSLNLMTPSTRTQLLMGHEICKNINEARELDETVQQCLKRDPDWTKYHAETLADRAETPQVDASATAGIPTAGNLIWQFKRTLFCAKQRVSVKSCEDLSSVTVRQRLQRYFDGLGTFPPEDSPEEYATYFEATYPDPADRRTVLDGCLAGSKPSYGHLVLAALMKLGKVRVVWTPNFDKLIEDAAVHMFGSTAHFVVATLDNSQVALQALNEGRWPLIGKMHGDFQSRRLKSTSKELLSQDSEIRRALIQSCTRYGLIVIGYSGRDESILNALEEAIDEGRGYPGGLFWFQRSDSRCLPAVRDLIAKAARSGIQAELLEVQTFDELLGDVIKQFEELPRDIAVKLDRYGSRVTDIPLVLPGQGWPVIRTNALPVTEWPTMCRRIVCDIGGTKEVRETIEKRAAKIVGARSKVGVLAFGKDAEIRKVFSPFHITDFDCHAIEPKKLRSESTELGLLRAALAHALHTKRPFLVKKTGSEHILQIDFTRASPSDLASLKECAGGQLNGKIPNTSVDWSEALKIKLDYQMGRLWLLMEPTIYFGEIIEPEQRYTVAGFIRERLAVRYNRQWNVFIEAWLTLLMGNKRDMQLRTFGIEDGIDAAFSLTRITAFSRRNGSR